MIIKLGLLCFLGLNLVSANEDIREEMQNTTSCQTSIEVPPSISIALQKFNRFSQPWYLQKEIDQQTPSVQSQCCELIFEKIGKLTEKKEDSLVCTLCLVIMNSKCAFEHKKKAADSLGMTAMYTRDSSYLENFVKVNKENEERKEIFEYVKESLEFHNDICSALSTKHLK